MKNATKKIVLTAQGKVNKNVQNALMRCRFKENKIYTGYYLGAKKNTTAHSALSVVTSILKAQGYSFEIGNDSVRGGILGQYVKCSKVAFNFILKIKG